MSGSKFIEVIDLPAGNGEGDVRVIELRRPEKLNCLSLEMLDELNEVLSDATTAARRRSPADQRNGIVLTAVGRAFCTGLDLTEVTEPNNPKRQLERLVQIYKQLLSPEIGVTVFAQGYAAGGGVGLVACATTAIVSEGFRVRLPAGNLSRLASVVVPLCEMRSRGAKPRESGWLGCELNAADASSLGLVDQVVPTRIFEQLIAKVREGELSEFGRRVRDPRAIERALTGLDGFMRKWE